MCFCVAVAFVVAMLWWCAHFSFAFQKALHALLLAAFACLHAYGLVPHACLPSLFLWHMKWLWWLALLRGFVPST